MTILPDLTGQTITSIEIIDFGRNIIDIHLASGKTLSIWGDCKLAIDSRLIELDKIETRSAT
jgi:hypothetical protein